MFAPGTRPITAISVAFLDILVCSVYGMWYDRRSKQAASLIEAQYNMYLGAFSYRHRMWRSRYVTSLDLLHHDVLCVD